MILLIFAFIFAILEWLGEYLDNRGIIVLTKPAAMVSLIAWMWTYSDLPSLVRQPASFPILWFLTGLIFCLAGDVFLMLPPEKFFLPGLVVFLIGHIFYILGFGQIFPPGEAILPGIVIAGMLAALFVTIYRKLAQGLDASGKPGLKLPVGAYAVVISVMLYAALLTMLRQEWHYSAAWLASLGALLFYISDILNAWMRFVAPIALGRLKVMATYHLGQIALTAGVVLHFSGRIG